MLLISFFSSVQNTGLLNFFNDFPGLNLLVMSSIALLNCSIGPPSTPSERIPVNHGSVDVVSSTLYLKSVRRARRLVASRASLARSVGASFTSLMYLMAFAVVSMSWIMVAAKPTTVTASMMTFDTSPHRHEKAKHVVEVPCAAIQSWIEQIPGHIKEIVRLEGGNEYQKGRDDEEQ
jgi:hypothetical protein